MHRTALALALVSALALNACDPRKVARLEEGVSTEADVRREFGEPVTLTVRQDGSRVFEYPRQPEGWTNYRIVVGADGKMSSLRQLLNEDNFARVKPGMTKQQVRELLGRPARTQRYDLKQEEVWEWRFKPLNEARLFSVTFDREGLAVASMTGDDPREAQGR
jgi:2-polyprenyl-6-methoxyphenol hydroxylase-like FAD-dependent oxidoreductase